MVVGRSKGNRDVWFSKKPASLAVVVQTESEWWSRSTTMGQPWINEMCLRISANYIYIYIYNNIYRPSDLEIGGE